MDWTAVVLSLIALIAALFSARESRRTCGPSQLREHLARIEELEADLSDLHERVRRREQKLGMADARQVVETRRERRDKLEEEALAVIKAAQAAGGAPATLPAPDLTTPEGRAAAKAALRRQLGG